jgi:4-hydroxy-tetrahydrodipicolinate reductase
VSAEVLRVAVIGSHGRLGGVLARAIDAAGDLQLVAKLGRDTPRALLAQSGAQVALEVTGPTSVLANVRTCLDAGVSVVVGASGLAAEDLADLRTRLADSPELGVLVAPNFSVGAVLAEALAARAAAGFGAIPDATTQDPDGARGAEIHGIHVHSIRLPGLVAHQEVLFGGTGETLSIRHDSTSRDSFVSGALLALRRVLSLPGLTVGLETLLGLAAAEPEPAR